MVIYKNVKLSIPLQKNWNGFFNTRGPTISEMGKCDMIQMMSKSEWGPNKVQIYDVTVERKLQLHTCAYNM